MKTLFLGDLHLMCGLILPNIELLMDEYNVMRVVMTGDYVDQWGMIYNDYLYRKDLTYLLEWKSQKKEQGREIITLIGNHEIPYLTGEKAVYSADSYDTFRTIRELLLALDMQVAYKVEEYLVSHSGYTVDYAVEDWHFDAINDTYTERLKTLYHHVGFCRGGSYFSGSPIWADLQGELSKRPNRNYDKQIVGHSPVSTVTKLKDIDIIAVDTFSLSREHLPLGDGSVLIYDSNKTMVAENIWWNLNPKKIKSYLLNQEL